MPSTAPYRVLCVDDEVSGLRPRQSILQRKGFLVHAASNVREALSLFAADDFDLVVTDHLLGRETGTAMAKEMKRLKPHVPILLLSGATDIPEGLEPADAFMSKAEGTESLLTKVNQMVARSRERKGLFRLYLTDGSCWPPLWSHRTMQFSARHRMERS